MALFFVVTRQPFCGDLSHLIHRLKHIGSEHFSSIGPTIALDEGLLIRFPQLNITQLDLSLCTPGDEALGEKLLASVEANRLRLAPPGSHAQHSSGWQRRIHFDGQALPHSFIQNIKDPNRLPP